jgi:hypothetical protein
MRIRIVIRELMLIAAIGGMSWAEQPTCAQDVSLEVRTKDGRSGYHIGEPIALQLTFSSSSKQYIVDTSFRFPDLSRQMDEFIVSPSDGVSDPMEDYRRALSKSVLAFDFSGGLSGFGRLGDKPVTLDLFLNRYVRFSKPGHYVLSIRDRRVSVVRNAPNEPAQEIELMSKPLILTIASADAGWQQGQLASALEVLKKSPGVDVNVCEIVTSLGTPEAEVAMADGLLDENKAVGCGFTYALLGVRNRTLVLEHMQQKLESPETSVAPQFVETMASLMAVGEEGRSSFSQTQAEARERINDQLLELLDTKRGAARFAAISTLVTESLNSGGVAQGTQVLRLAAEVFDRLSEQAQSTLLSARWKDVASPPMVGVLRRCAEAESTSTCDRLQGDLLLTRLNELSPSDAREVILGDTRKENPRFPARVLAILPDKELPEMDVVLRAHLQSTDGNVDTTAELIERYATGAIAGAVQSYLDEKGLGQLGGQVEPNLIAYLLRIQPDVGAQKLRAALAVRNGSGWYKYMLRDVAQRTPSAVIQPIAIDALSDTDPEVVQSAVQALALIGDEHAKAALFERLGEWRTRWMGRERDMFWIPGDGPITDDRYLGDELIRAIATGAGWLLTEEDQRQLLRSAVTENQKQQAKQFVDGAKNRPIEITIINAGSLHVQIIVAQYNYESMELVKGKLSQFPARTSFLLQSIPPGSAETRSAVAEIESFLAQHGMHLETRKMQ